MNINTRRTLKDISNRKRHLEEEAHAHMPGRISVCIPNYNKGPWIYDCLKSIAEQTYQHLEIIVVDDFSSDNSMAEIRRFERDYRGKMKHWLTIVPLDRRRGTAWAQNIAYFISRGEFIANQDSDDVADPWRLQKQKEALLLNSWDVVGTNYLTFDSDPTKPIVADGGPWLKYGTDEVEEAYLIRGHHCMCFGTLMLKREVLDVTGGLTKEFIGTEDFDFCLRVAQKGFVMNNIKDVLYYYRTNRNQRSTLFHSSSV